MFDINLLLATIALSTWLGAIIISFCQEFGKTSPIKLLSKGEEKHELVAN